MVEQKFVKQQSAYDDMAIYTSGFPDYISLTKAEKRILLLPLVEVIREFYKDPENRRKFEEWKIEYLKQNPDAEQGFILTCYLQIYYYCFGNGNFCAT